MRARSAAVLNRQRFGVRMNQIVLTQAALALLLAGAALGGAPLLLTALCTVLVIALTWARAHGRWVFRWLAAYLRFAVRRRAARISSPAAVLTFAAPRTLVSTIDLAGTPTAVLTDELGLTILVELTEPTTELPPLRTLLTDNDQPPTRLQLVLTGVSAHRGPGPVAGSYREIGGGLAQLSAVLAYRVLRADGWSSDDLRRTLTTRARRLVRRLQPWAPRPLDKASGVRVIAHLAQADTTPVAREFWPGVRLGGLLQATFQCTPSPGATLPSHLIPHLLLLPATATTLTVTTDLSPGGTTSLMIRLAAPGATALTNAAQLLRNHLAPLSIDVQRWDGAHLPGLAATLPLALSPDVDDSLPDFAIPPVPAGLLVGRNRQGEPAPVPFFRPDPTLALVAGGLACAQMLTFRALATGARVTVRSNRTSSWSAFTRATGNAITVLPPGRPVNASPGSPLHPTLVVLDTGTAPALPAGTAEAPAEKDPVTIWPGLTETSSTPPPRPRPLSAPAPDPDDRWRTTLVVRDTLAETDLRTATSADLLILQPLSTAEADLLGEALQLGETATLLTRMRPAMVAMVSRSTVRWAALAPTPTEKALIGDLTRPSLSDKSRYD
ncbi:type VII secretion protein EccE [Actinoplanes sp. NPDC051861]|uniref:type VII secretion protein EccE n=1 Tax=Actinoplanes sp. NPDC051861 TaxID=3155170 RepID=UPI00341A639D